MKETNTCEMEVPKEECLCRKCIYECYVSSCSRKIAIGGMCHGVGTIECDKFIHKQEEKE